MIDLALSLGSGTGFLGCFQIYRRLRVLLVSCESGAHTVQETARRICRAKGINLADTDTRWWFAPYQLADQADLARLARSIKHHKPEVVLLDPLYLMLLSGNAGRGLEAGNIFDVGPLLLGISRTCLDEGATPFLAHHARKSLSKPNEPMELEDLAFAGSQEFARQWLLTSRRVLYEPGTGEHRLWLSAGGSCGQGGLWGLDINEGTLSEDFSGRRWDVKVITPGGQQTSKQERAVRDHGTRVLAALDQLIQDGKTSPVANGEGVGVGVRQLKTESGLNSDNLERAINALCREHVTERVTIVRPKGKKDTQEAEGLRRKPVSGTAAGF